MDSQRVNNINLNVNPVNIRASQTNQGTAPGNKTFSEALTRAFDESVNQLSGLKFSKHAATRINSREVELSPEQLKRVEEGVNAARVKGVSDSLVLVDGYALVVNTLSKTVVTAMNSAQRNDGVFTNINGAVIV